MRIISTTSEPNAPAQTSYVSPTDRLINHHPAGMLFDVAITAHRKHGITLTAMLRHSFMGSEGNIASTAGCLIDLATRLAVMDSLGSSQLMEYEVQAYAPLTASNLQVSVDIESATDQHVTYCCSIYGRVAQKKQLLVKSCGTLSLSPVALAKPGYYGS